MAEMIDGSVVVIDGTRYLVNEGALVEIKTAPVGKASKGGKAKHVATPTTFKPVEGVYKGKATLQLTGFPHPFTFGATRARLIVENFDMIRAFAAKHPAK